MKHSFTWVALLDILQIFNNIYNKKILPETKYMLRKFLRVSTDSINYHMMCCQCNRYLGKQSNLKTKTRCRCGFQVNTSSVGSYFVELDIKYQLGRLFTNENIAESLSYRFNRQKINEDGLEDIYDGKVYKAYYAQNDNLLKNKYNFSYILNTDGYQASDCSKISIWPMYIMLNELPPNLRRENMILDGLWVSKMKPDMNVYMQPFVNQANDLSSNGFKWSWKGEEITSKLFPLG